MASRALHVWHRRAGVIAALVLAVVAVTGFALNHTESLRLDERLVRNRVVLALYGAEAPPVPIAFAVDGHHVALIGERLYLDEREVARVAGPLIGAVAHEGGYAAAVPGELLLLTADGALLERLDDADGVPSGIRALGLTLDGRLAVRAAHGDYIADLVALQWTDVGRAEARWARPVALPETRRAALAAAYRGRGMPLERVLLDLHSGRIFGRWGVYVVDAAAIAALLLAGTGLWMWGRGRRFRG